MSTIDTSQFEKGITVLFKNNVYMMVDREYVNPGKGSAFVKTKLKQVLTGSVVEHTFKSGETIELAPTELLDMQYLYTDENNCYFMDSKTYEQFSLPIDVVGMNKNFLKEGTVYTLVMYEGKPITMKMPPKVTLKVTQAEPNVKGDTATTAQKNATVETGFVLRVPIFIEPGNMIIINTEEGKYVERSKG